MFGLYLLPHTTRRVSSRVRVKKEPTYLPRRRIVPTDAVYLTDFIDDGSPIVVVPHEGKYYICDGNHRFASRKGGIWCVVLLAKDRRLIDRRQKRIPNLVESWAAGKIDYERLVKLTVSFGRPIIDNAVG